MRTSAQFAQVLRKGRRGSTSSLVVHALPRDERGSHHDDSRDAIASDPVEPPAGDAATQPVLVGFVVGKAVGNSVSRHRVSRQLRAAVAPRLDELDAYRGVVVRALPSSAGRPTADLAGDLAVALGRLRGRPRRGAAGGGS